MLNSLRAQCMLHRHEVLLWRFHQSSALRRLPQPLTSTSSADGVSWREIARKYSATAIRTNNTDDDMMNMSLPLDATSNDTSSLHHMNESSLPQSSASSTSSRSSSTRNKGIAEVIRAGWAPLNQTAVDIQNSPATHKPLFRNGATAALEEEEEVSPRIKSEEHRILSVAKDCLHQMEQSGSSKYSEEMAVFSALGGMNSANDEGDDMIVLLNVEIKKGSNEAILFWCLPYDILLDDNIPARQKQFLEFRVQQKLEERGTKMLQRRVHSVLRHYYPPKLRLEPATNDQLKAVLEELSDW